MHAEKAQVPDTWAQGSAYEPYVGRWSRLVARELVTWLAMPPASTWLDAGCGTGALTETILALAAPSKVTGLDASEGFITHAAGHNRDPRTRFLGGDLQFLPFEDRTFDAAVSGLVLNFVPDKKRALAEMARVVRHNGAVALYVWDYAEGMQFMRYFWDAAADGSSTAAVLDEGQRFPICQPQPLAQLFRDTGLHDVQVRAIDIPTIFQDFDDYWLPFLGGQGSAPSYLMTLDEEERAGLRERLRRQLPVSPGGRIHLIARAWAARGRR